MGNETSTLQQYDILDPFENNSSKIWIHHPAIRQDDSKVSLFVHDKNNKEDSHCFENATKYLKILRHPCILKYYDCFDTNGSSYLVTEPVQPLECVLDSLTTPELCAGIHNILEGIHFLHDKGGLCHNNICLAAIFVAEDGMWKLGSMEHVCKYNEATPSFLEKCVCMRDEKSISPEEKEGKLIMSEEYGHARDVYAFGILVQHFLDYLRDLGEVTEEFEQRIELECLNPDPTQRPKLNILITDTFFKNDFLEILNFLHNIPVKTEKEKADFFKSAASKLYNLPSKLVATRLGHLLLSRFVLLEPIASEQFLEHFLSPCYAKVRPEEFVEGQTNPMIPADEFSQYIIPELLHIFTIPENHLRLVLLNYFPAFAPLISKEILQNQILPQLLLGLKDTCDTLVAASLRSLADLVPLVGGGVIIGVERAKYFGEGKPKFQKLLPSIPTTFLNEKSDSNSDPPSSNTDIKDKTEFEQNLIITQDNSDMALKKQEEKKLRREEMKRKREERRKKREEEHQILAMVEEEKLAAEKISLDETSSINSIIDDPMVELLERSAPDGGEAVPEKPSTLTGDPEQKPEDEWSDWEALQDDSDGTIERDKSEQLVLSDQTSETYHSSIISHVISHSSVVNKDKKVTSTCKGAMKLTESLQDSKENKMHTLSTCESKKTALPLVKNKLGHDLTEKPLGQEFDVLAVEIKTNSLSSEVNFFADMEPVINKTISTFPVPVSFKSENENKLSYNLLEEDTTGWEVDDY